MCIPLSLLVGDIKRPDVLCLISSENTYVDITARALEDAAI